MEEKILPTIRINNKLYYSFEQAAKILKISVSTLRREINKKNIRYLPHNHYGNVFLPEWLDEWLEHKIVVPRFAKR